MVKQQIITKSQMMAITNAVTNEVETAKVTMIVQRDVQKYKGEKFAVFFQAANRAIARKIRPVTAKLLLYLVAISEWENRIPGGIREIASELDYTPRNVLIAMKELEELQIVIREKNPEDKRQTNYSLNALQSWKGTVKERKEKLSQYSPNQMNMLKMFDETPELKLKPSSEF